MHISPWGFNVFHMCKCDNVISTFGSGGVVISSREQCGEEDTGWWRSYISTGTCYFWLSGEQHDVSEGSPCVCHSAPWSKFNVKLQTHPSLHQTLGCAIFARSLQYKWNTNCTQLLKRSQGQLCPSARSHSLNQWQTLLSWLLVLFVDLQISPNMNMYWCVSSFLYYHPDLI